MVNFMSWSHACLWFISEFPNTSMNYMFCNSEIKSYTSMVPGQRVDHAVLGGKILFFPEKDITYGDFYIPGSLKISSMFACTR